jgi:hypothetical protein
VKGLGWKDRVEGLERKGWGALSRKDGRLESGRVELEGLELEGLDSGRVGQWKVEVAWSGRVEARHSCLSLGHNELP